MEYVTLNNGVKMPILGYGVYQVTKEECERCVLDALKVGYRAIDTAQSYFNERGVGEGVRTCGIPREDLFVVSKVAAEHKTYEQAMAGIDETLKKMGLYYQDFCRVFCTDSGIQKNTDSFTQFCIIGCNIIITWRNYNNALPFGFAFRKPCGKLRRRSAYDLFKSLCDFPYQCAFTIREKF